MGWLDDLIYGVRKIFASGVEQPERGALDFAGAGVVVTDDPTNGRTTITIPGGSSSDLVQTPVKTSAYTAALGELVRVDASAGAVTVSMPPAGGATGREVAVLRVDGILPGAHAVTVAADDGVNDEATHDITYARGLLLMRSDGVTWRILGEFVPRDPTVALVGAYIALGATPAASTGQVRATDGTLIGVRSGGVDQMILATAAGTTTLGGAHGPIIESVGASNNWTVADGGGARLTVAPNEIQAGKLVKLYGGAVTHATAAGHLGLDSTGRPTAWVGGAEVSLATMADAASALKVPLDASDMIEWTLEEAAGPWANTGNGGACSLTASGPAIVVVPGASPFGTNCVLAAYGTSGLASAATTIGQSTDGTIHGWVRHAGNNVPYNGDIISKDGAVAYLKYAGTCGADSDLLSGQVNASAATVTNDQAGSFYWLRRMGWHHVALTWTGGNHTIYVDGRIAATGTYVGLPWTGSTWVLGNGLDAWLSNWRVCNVARSQAYLLEVYRRAVGTWR